MSSKKPKKGRNKGPRKKRGERELSNPFSTGGGGPRFEANVQASFVALMLSGGYAPCLPNRPIEKVKLQGRFAGYQTDDLIVFVQDLNGKGHCRLLGQVKHSITISEKNSTFDEVIQSAWRDFNNSQVFTRKKDVIALITGPLSATDINDVRFILERARYSENSREFFDAIQRAHFSSNAKRRKLLAFEASLKKASGNTITNEEVFEFLRHFHLLGYDLDVKAGVTFALLHSLISQYSPTDAHSVWARLVDEVQSANQNAGTISASSIPEDLQSAFRPRNVEAIPTEFAIPSAPASSGAGGNQAQIAALTLAALLGGWNEGNSSDIEIIRRLVDGF